MSKRVYVSIDIAITTAQEETPVSLRIQVSAATVKALHAKLPQAYLDQRAHSNRKLRFQGFCHSIRLIERIFWSFYSTVRSDMQYWLASSWPYNLLSDKALRITVYSCVNAPAGPSSLQWP